jgi:hypothetical protein
MPPSEDGNRRRSISAVLAANASGTGSARKGSTEGEMKDKAVLADLPKEQYMVGGVIHTVHMVSLALV